MTEKKSQVGASAGQDILNDLAPAGRLKAAINLGNVVLAQRDASNGEIRGVSVALARALAHRLSVPLDLIPFDTAGKVTDSASQGVWTVGFLANEPARASEVTFSAPYVIIEGNYLVRDSCALTHLEDFDRQPVRIAVGNKTAYDLFLTRNISQATLVRAPTSAAALQMFIDENLEAAAGIRQALDSFAADHSGLRVIVKPFMAINQAMVTPRGKQAGARYVHRFIEEMKAEGFIASALAESGQVGKIAPRAEAGR